MELSTFLASLLLLRLAKHIFVPGLFHPPLEISMDPSLSLFISAQLSPHYGDILRVPPILSQSEKNIFLPYGFMAYHCNIFLCRRFQHLTLYNVFIWESTLLILPSKIYALRDKEFHLFCSLIHLQCCRWVFNILNVR